MNSAGNKDKYAMVSVRSLMFTLAVVATIVFSSSFERAVPTGPKIPHFDKIAHFCVFGLLATLAFRSVRLPLVSWGRFFIGLAVAMGYGAIDEWIQFYNPGRDADWLDWFTDAGGALLAVSLYRYWAGYRRLLEWRIFSK